MSTLPDHMVELVADHLAIVPSLVAQVAARYPRHTDREELVQAGRLGLVEAARRYDPARGVPFERWASLRIRGAIVDAVRSIDVAPRSLRSAARKVECARASLTHELGRTPESAEIAERAGLTVDQFHARTADVHRALVLSLDAPCGAEDGQTLTLADSLVASADSDPLCQLEEREEAGYLRDAVTALPPRLRAVVEGYFLEGSSSADVARRLGVTESRVSQLRSEALALLRAGLSAQYADPDQAGEALPVPTAPTGDRAASARTVAYTAAVGQQRTFAERLTPLPAFIPPPRLVPDPILPVGTASGVTTLVGPRRRDRAAVALSA